MSLSDKQRDFVRERASYCCEYCRLTQSAVLTRFQVDHIISIKHNGTDSEDNLCLACFECNSYKGSDVAAIDSLTDKASKLYHPRQQKWDEHFKINDDATLSGLTSEGRTTIAVLRINDEERVKQRLGEMEVGDYPCENT